MQQVTSTAYFSDSADAQRAVEELREAGVPDADIDLQSQSTTTSRGGGFMENLKDFFGMEADDDRYASGAVLTVYGNREIAVSILRRYRADFDAPQAYDDDIAEDAQAASTQRLRLREERVNASKRRVQQGEVRLGKDIIEEEQVIDVPITREQVRVTRTPVREGDYAEDAGEIGDGDEISVPVMREDVDVEKHSVVTGEVGLEKTSVQDTERVTAKVRKERARVESTGGVDTNDDNARQ